MTEPGQTGKVLDFNSARRQGEPLRHSVDAEDIRARLHADAQAFIDWMYCGRALCKKGEARIGDVLGTPGASLSIQLTGSDAGLWKDHATGEGGDLIELYRAFRGYQGREQFVLSLKEIAKDFLGDPVEIERSTWAPTPREQIDKRRAELGTRPRADMVELGAPVATYKYYDTRGNVIASVVRFEPDGTRENKTFRPFCFRTVDGVTKWIPGMPDLRPLYCLPEISISPVVVLVEGEGAADALNAVGIPATSAMGGAEAPIDKTDWSPLAGKTVIVWPDKDEPGFKYARAVADRLTTLGCTVKGVTPPEEARAKWDAKDCIDEGGDPAGLINGAVPVSEINTPKSSIRLFNFAALATEDYEEEPDYLGPDLLGPSTFMLIAGPPKAQKSWLVQDINIALATGSACLGGMMSAPQPLRVFYLQAEMHEKLLRRRAKATRQWLSDDDLQLLSTNLIVSERFRMILDADGVEKVVALIKNDFPGGAPDVISFDPLINLFDQENESDNAQMMKFLQLRIEAVRERVNPRAGIIMVHHATKTSPEEIRKDPFRIIRGAGALRGHYDTGIIIFKKAEDTEEREIHFDLRAAESPKSISALLVNGTFKHQGTTENDSKSNWPPDGVQRDILEAIDQAWRQKLPWSLSPQTRREGRFAPRMINVQFGINAKTAEKMVIQWLDNGVLEVKTYDAHSKAKGLKITSKYSAEVPEEG